MCFWIVDLRKWPKCFIIDSAIKAYEVNKYTLKWWEQGKISSYMREISQLYIEHSNKMALKSVTWITDALDGFKDGMFLLMTLTCSLLKPCVRFIKYLKWELRGECESWGGSDMRVSKKTAREIYFEMILASLLST